MLRPTDVIRKVMLAIALIYPDSPRVCAEGGGAGRVGGDRCGGGISSGSTPIDADNPAQSAALLSLHCYCPGLGSFLR